MAERGEDGWLPVISVESHELASPGKRLLWHLEHFRAPIEQCQFAGAPIHALETRPEVKRLLLRRAGRCGQQLLYDDSFGSACCCDYAMG